MDETLTTMTAAAGWVRVLDETVVELSSARQVATYIVVGCLLMGLVQIVTSVLDFVVFWGFLAVLFTSWVRRITIGHIVRTLARGVRRSASLDLGRLVFGNTAQAPGPAPAQGVSSATPTPAAATLGRLEKRAESILDPEGGPSSAA